MTVALHELECRLTGQEERPIYSQFKMISNNDIPRISEQSDTQIGRFKKNKNETKFFWNHASDERDGPQV